MVASGERGSQACFLDFSDFGVVGLHVRIQAGVGDPKQNTPKSVRFWFSTPHMLLGPNSPPPLKPDTLNPVEHPKRM